MNRRIIAIVVVLLLILSVSPFPLLISSTPVHAADPGATIIFTFDDGWSDTYEYAFPIMEGAGFKGTVWVMRDFVLGELEDFMSISELNALYNTGWDLSNHTTCHWDHGDDTSPENLALLETYYRENQEWILSNGWERGAYHVCYPSGNFSDELIDLLQGMGVLTGRSVIDGLQTMPVDDFFRIPVQLR